MAKLSGAGNGSTSRRCWPKSPSGLNPLIMTSGSCATAFMSSVCSINEPIKSPQQTAGTELTKKSVNHVPGSKCKGCPACTRLECKIRICVQRTERLCLTGGKDEKGIRIVLDNNAICLCFNCCRLQKERRS